MKFLVRKIIPERLIIFYHLVVAVIATIWYRHPSKKLVVIGVTGTTGKSTTCHLIARILEAAGYRVGLSSTINFKIDNREVLNDTMMTMPGRFRLQQLLAQMANAGCHYAIIETTSEGMKQFRHWGVAYDVAVFTNVYPQHIQAHGSFENYKATKLKLFERLNHSPRKIISGRTVKKIIVGNLDDEHAPDFFKPMADSTYGFTVQAKEIAGGQTIDAKIDSIDERGIRFAVQGVDFKINLLGTHNITNALAAITVAHAQGLSLPIIAKALEKITAIPGRLEFIDEGQDFKVVVDYAFEPKAMEKLYEVVDMVEHKRVIHVMSCGGRYPDRWKVLGTIAGSKSDICVITDGDSYDADPETVMQAIAVGAIAAGKVENENLFKILDRGEAIGKAITLAHPGDIVLITGKGSEQALMGKHFRKTPWDDREAARKYLRIHLKKTYV